ncbi:MAG: TPM domain-containing protein [Oligoflexia bacterium]|nr:TPM domain-containing protein [Oligoflexia bacterium]
MKKILYLACALALLMPFALAIQIPSAAPLVDEARILSQVEKNQLDALLRKIKVNSGVEMSVLITPSLEGLAVEDYSLQVAESWGLGRKGSDKGILFLIAINDRKMRFEVGYGLEGDLTDAYSRRILDNYVRPNFRAGKYYEGILAGIAGVQERIPLGAEELNEYTAEADLNLPWFIRLLSSKYAPLFFLGLSFFIMILQIRYGRKIRSGRSYGGWSGGSSSWSSSGGSSWSSGGGSSWGGGGGGFGGGGSSSSW